MTNSLIAGLATIVVAGTALVGTGIYAANIVSTGAMGSTTYTTRMERGNPQNLIATLSVKVSPEALTALTTLMTKHKTEMDEMRSNTGTTINKTTMAAQHTAFQTEMDALLVKYPELKMAMPAIGKGMGGKMNRGNREVEAIIATLPTTVQTELKSIHDSYQTKHETLRTEEKAKVDAILTPYPEVKSKLHTIESNPPQGGGMMGSGWHSRWDRQDQENTSDVQ